MDTEPITALFAITKEARNEKIKTLLKKWKENGDKDKFIASRIKSMKQETFTEEEL